MTHPSDPNYRDICDDCMLSPDTCGHEREDCEQKVADAAADWADLRRKSILEDGD